MLSTLKNAKFIWIMNSGEDFRTSMVRPLGILVALVKIKIGKGSSKSVISVGKLFMSYFFDILCNLAIKK